MLRTQILPVCHFWTLRVSQTPTIGMPSMGVDYSEHTYLTLRTTVVDLRILAFTFQCVQVDVRIDYTQTFTRQ